MKKYSKYIISAALVLLTITACKENFDELSVNPNQLSLNGFYDTPQGVNAAVTAVYGYLTTPRNLGVSGKGMYMHHRSDEMSSGSDYAVTGQRNTKLASNWYTVQQPWGLMYTAALQASAVIENADQADYLDDDDLRDAYVGEAHMLRAFVHYFLLTNFRNIVIVDKVPNGDEFVQGQSKPADVWDFIVSDLTIAKGLLPQKGYWGASNNGRMTSGSAAGLLGKVYLTRSGIENENHYSAAAAEFNEVINGNHGTYDLTVDYNDNFGIENENNIESVLEFQFLGDGDENTGFNPGSNTSGLFSDPRGFAPPGLRCHVGCEAVVHDWVYNAFEASVDNDGRTDRRMFGTLVFDDRLLANGIPDLNNDSDLTNDRLALNAGHTWEEVYSEDGTFSGKLATDASVQNYQAANRKWLDWNLNIDGENVGQDDRFAQSRAHGPNWRFIRYADVLLMYAEAVLEGGTQGTMSPLDAVNAVRSRAKVPVLGSVDMDAVKAERILELTNEGHRGVDLLRWGELATRMADLEANDPNFKKWDNSIYVPFESPKNLYLPIPIDEIQSNPLINVQNPGW